MCRPLLLLLLSLASLLPSALWADVGGLAFVSPPNSIERRTSYRVFGNSEETFQKMLDLSFDMRLPYRGDVGYVVRIIDRRHDNVFNMFYDGRGNDYFALNREGYKSLLKIHFDRDRLRQKQWFKVRITFDMKRQNIAMSIDGQREQAHLGAGSVPLYDNASVDIVFGRSDYLIDVPTFAMRNLRVSDMDSQWHFPLEQTAGTAVVDSHGKKTGTVNNPYWLINDQYHWKQGAAWTSPSPAGHNYDTTTHTLFYYNRDTLFTYDTMTGDASCRRFGAPCPVQLYLGTSFIDPKARRLYTYETYRPHKMPDDPSVASLNLDTYQWTTESTTQIEEGQMHHHGAFFRPDLQQYTIYGGFANMRYSDRFYTYDVRQHRWIMLEDMQGDRFPRYFTAMGYDQQHYAYVFGGMGNDSGDQTVGRRFFYDLHRIDTRTRRVQKLWSIDWKEPRDIVFSKYMVLQRDSFYVLGYSEFKSNSCLRLYRFSLHNGQYVQLGDSIPIHPDRIETETSLFYDPLLRRFVVAVQEFKNEHLNTLRTYTLDAPALDAAAYSAYRDNQERTPWLPIATALSAACAVALGMLLMVQRKRRTRRQTATDHTAAPAKNRTNAIYLFGPFTAIGRDGHDISHLFTDKLRLLFCVLLQHSTHGGISSQRLGYEIWGDKAPEKIKSSKNVAINHLRKALKELDGIQLVYEGGHFRIDISRPLYCDYTQLRHLIDDTGGDLLARRAEVFEVLLHGKFLAGADDPLLDTFKSDTDSMLIKPLCTLMDTLAEQAQYADVLRCVHCIFCIDPVNEHAFDMQTQALKRMGRTRELQEAVIRFNDTYKKTYGESPEEEKQ